jgi:RNA polymerase sigma-70 factor (ECF subfamily)
MSTTHEMVRAARAGEEEGWNILYNQYYPALYAIALQHCDDATIAQDMVQEAFTIAFLKLNQLKDTMAFSGWIKSILLHACHKHYRRNRKTRWGSITASETENLWHDDLNRQQDLLSVRSTLHASIAGLPEVLRTTLLLRYFSAFQSYEDIAAILSIPVGTVRSRLNQAKLKLSEQWKKRIDVNSKTLYESASWNSFYESTLSGMHHHENCKDRFIKHLRNDVRIITPGHKSIHDNSYFEGMIYNDRKAGSWLSPFNIITSGNISVVESKHFNSPEHPDHCPAGSVMVIHRTQDKVSTLQLQVFKS